MRNFILIAAVIYAVYNIAKHLYSLILRLKLRKSINNKEVVHMNNVVFDFKNMVSRIQLILAVNEGIFDHEKLINEENNKNVVNLRRIMVKAIGSLPLNEEDEIILKLAEDKMSNTLSKAISFDKIKLVINLIFFITIILMII